MFVDTIIINVVFSLCGCWNCFKYVRVQIVTNQCKLNNETCKNEKEICI